MSFRISLLFTLGNRTANILLKANSTPKINLAKVMSGISIPPSKYPLARRDETVVDDFHGTKVVDPYRWMEDPDLPETQAWVTELNNISEPFLAEGEHREKINQRLTALWDYEKYGCTGYHGNHYYYWYNSGLQNQSVLYQQKDYKEKGSLFFDPNVLSADGTTSLRSSRWTEDGKIWAYGLSEKGSDWMTLKFKSESGDDLSDTVKGVKHSSIAWLSDNSGVFYSRYPEHKSATEGSSVEKHQNHSLYFHKLGTPQSEDFLVADFRHDPNLMNSGTVTEDGRYLLVYVSKGCDPVNQVFYYDLESVKNKFSGKLDLKPFFDKSDAKYDIIDTDGDTALVMTNHEAPFFKLVRVKFGPDGNDPSKWEVVIAEDSERKLDFASAVDGNKLMVGYLEDCCSKLYVNDIKSGKVLHQVPMEIGALSGLSCDKKRSEVFFSFESFLAPTVIYRFDFKDMKDGELKIEETRRVQIKDFDPSKFKVQQIFTKSKDGTKVPMFIVRRADLKHDGQNVTILNGYGGFNVADTPCFSISRILFLNNLDGVVACANLRGGSEYGEKWHENGMLHKKQNVFDDFIACAEYLIDNKFTSPNKLAIHGGSNGGLLVGAVSQQRPDIIGAAINRVGVLDMLRFHQFTVGSAWLPEYGNPEKNKDDFECIYKYSPLHNIRMKDGVEWPATLLMSADHDDRVVSAHSLKYIAQLYYVVRNEAANFQKKPLICRIEVKAGHGAGKPTSKIIAEITDIYSFVSQVLGAQYHD
jgi:prolyl oligopeptidase